MATRRGGYRAWRWRWSVPWGSVSRPPARSWRWPPPPPRGRAASREPGAAPPPCAASTRASWPRRPGGGGGGGILLGRRVLDGVQVFGHVVEERLLDEGRPVLPLAAVEHVAVVVRQLLGVAEHAPLVERHQHHLGRVIDLHDAELVVPDRVRRASAEPSKSTHTRARATEDAYQNRRGAPSASSTSPAAASAAGDHRTAQRRMWCDAAFAR